MKTPFNVKPGFGIVVPESIACPLCGRTYKLLGFYRHLKVCVPAHGLDFAGYEHKYARTLYGPGHAFGAQWCRLAAFSSTRFGLGNYRGCYWFQVHTTKNSDAYYLNLPARNGQPERRIRRPETKALLREENGTINLRQSFAQFRDHLRGRLPLAIVPDMDNRFLMIDLDRRQTRHLPALLKRIKARGLAYHLEFSGGKGYHIWIFFRDVVRNELLIALHDELSEGLETDHKLWPFKNSLIKLPQGLHPKTHNFAGFLKSAKVPIPMEEQLKYFLNIQPIDFPKDISVQCKTPLALTCSEPKTPRSRPRKKSANTRSEWQLSDEQCAELLQNNTRPAGLSRYYLLFRLPVYLKEVEHRTELESREILIGWSRCVSQTPDHELVYDAKRQVKSVFARRIRRSCDPLPELSVAQKNWIHAHIDELLTERIAAGHRLDRNQAAQARDALRRLAEYLVRLVLWKNGRAYTSFEGIASKTGVKRNRIDKWLSLLCGDMEENHENEGHKPYHGRLLIRVGFASRPQKLAQEYILSPKAAAALSTLSAA